MPPRRTLLAATRTLVRTIAKACAREGVAATRAVLDSLSEQSREQYPLLKADMLAGGIARDAGGTAAAAGDAGAGAGGEDAADEDEDEPGPA